MEYLYDLAKSVNMLYVNIMLDVGASINADSDVFRDFWGRPILEWSLGKGAVLPYHGSRANPWCDSKNLVL